ncbi:Pr6Pr family membrane protein [Antarctobacter heliothermus]|uniref:FAR-17a/AIG1-like protein n=1 Tax=Antarctobacter heliothermus TaxID=74033 RepID=A0A239M3E2_9RHOB|nr:Pr6Pr family membrane protein [Antarctobacter heliothermus]SNT37130.1 FAR-17a/AIG1-like protein [Antarctobacter heliothermus]
MDGNNSIHGYSSAARRVALGVAAVAAITLLTRIYLRSGEDGGVIGAISYLSQFFTILTNAVVMVLMLLIASGRHVLARWIKAIVIAIVIVGIIYHLLLAHLVEFVGLAFWADHGVHTVVPALSVLWWLVFAFKPPLRVSDLTIWVAWPVLYCTYILIRAHFSGFYPYPFLNLPELGWSGLSVSIAGLLASFVVVGLALTAIGRFASTSRS